MPNTLEVIFWLLGYFHIVRPIKPAQLWHFPSCFCNKLEASGHIIQSKWAEEIKFFGTLWNLWPLSISFERLKGHDTKINNRNIYYGPSFRLQVSFQPFYNCLFLRCGLLSNNCNTSMTHTCTQQRIFLLRDSANKPPATDCVSFVSLMSVCSCDLVHSGFFCHSGEYICTEDYQRLYGTQCDSCGQYISGEVVSALGRTYHPHCFVCSMCRSGKMWNQCYRWKIAPLCEAAQLTR